MLGGRYLMDTCSLSGLADHSAGGLPGVGRSAAGRATAGREVEASTGTATSSIRRSVTCVSPFRVGRGPRAGSDTSFHGHTGGINHSMASRLGCPWPMIFPSRFTRYPRTETILPGTGSIEAGKERRSKFNFSQPFPPEKPGSLGFVRTPPRYTPLGKET